MPQLNFIPPVLDEPLPEVIDLEQTILDAAYACIDSEGVVHSRHRTFVHEIYTETDDSNGPIIGLMCPRCGYWAGTVELLKKGIITIPHRWPQ